MPCAGSAARPLLLALDDLHWAYRKLGIGRRSELTGHQLD